MSTLHTFARWTIFNAVGALGMGVQLAVLAALVRWLGVNYLLATALAVEAAVLHNFVWHQRWTWRDRPAATLRTVAVRLAAFHAINGAVSLAGNLVLMAWLVGVLKVDPILANVAAIFTCSVINFLAGTTLVFRAAPPAAIALLLIGSATVSEAGQGNEALLAWKAYEATVEARYAEAVRGGDKETFFVRDALDGNTGWRASVIGDGVKTKSVDTPSVEDATIHHWVGAVFVPGVTLDHVLSTLQDQAGKEETLYEDVVRSRLLSRDGDRLSVFMKLRRKTVLTVIYNTEHDVEYRRIGTRRAASRSVSTRIAEVGDAGKPSEYEKPPGQDHGFLWRLNAYWRYEETTKGVLIECESVSLSRGVPSLARPVVSPIINRVARESLVRTLQAVRGVLD